MILGEEGSRCVIGFFNIMLSFLTLGNPISHLVFFTIMLSFTLNSLSNGTQLAVISKRWKS